MGDPTAAGSPQFAGLARLAQDAAQVRRDVFEMIVRAGKGHIGGSLSCTDLLVVLYGGGVLRHDPTQPKWGERDRLVFSKGHAAEALYAVLALYGFFSPETLLTYGHPGSPLGGHVDNRLPGVEVSTGSLGHGLGVGAGIALAARLDDRQHRTFVLLGDGECYEGSVWEAAAFAAHHRLSGLVAIVDRNGQITLDRTEDCNRLEPLAEKWRAFGWTAREVDGHDHCALVSALREAREGGDGPTVVLARTVKGKGISFMEGSLDWHHGVPKGDQVAIARRELGGSGAGR